jgi:hypothetical protein
LRADILEERMRRVRDRMERVVKCAVVETGGDEGCAARGACGGFGEGVWAWRWDLKYALTSLQGIYSDRQVGTVDKQDEELALFSSIEAEDSGC